METIINSGMMLFLSFIMFFGGLYVNKFSNNGIIFGVRVPKEYEKDKEILKLEKEYKKFYIWLVTPVILISNIIVFIYSKTSVFLLFTFILIIIVNIPVIIYWKKMIRLKEENNWRKLGKNVVVVDTSIRKPKNKEDMVGIKNRSFLYLMIIPVIDLVLTFINYKNIPEKFPIHFNASGVADGFATKSGVSGMMNLIMLPVIAILIILSFMAMNKFAINGKVDINSGSLSEIKEQRKKFKLYNSIILYSILLEMTIIFSLLHVAIIYSWDSSVIKVISITFTVIIILTSLVSIIIGYKIGQGGKNIKINKKDEEIYRDDDRYWILGNFYYNKNDPSIFVEKRIGIGWDVNLGDPIGMLLMIIPIILTIGVVIAFFIKGI